VNIRESVGIALEALRANKLRSFLTLLGVIIGVSSVIAVMSLVQGLNQYMSEKLTSAGSNVFQIDKVGLEFDDEKMKDKLKRDDLLPEDAEAIARFGQHVEAAVAERGSSQMLRRGSKTLQQVRVRGVQPGYMLVNDLEVEHGRPLNDLDHQTRAPVCVIGSEVEKHLFGSLDPLDQDIRLGAYRLTVIGVGKKLGSAFGASQDMYVLVPFGTFEKLHGRNESVSISVRSRGQEWFNTAQDEARGILRARRHVEPGEEDDFDITTPEMYLDLYRNLSGAIFIVIIGVSVISLVVSGIVIMNIMLVSVTERTREIGVRKALGARRADILAQFLIEAVTLSGVGGAIGLALGILFSVMIGLFSPLPTYVSPVAMFLGVAMATLVGVFFGAYPASRAAAQDPIEALRYE
jgi:putative ABC transport system permease protein